MSANEASESTLVADLAGLGDRISGDDQFAGELYRALAGGHLTKSGAAVAPSWSRAEEIVNGLRGGSEPLTLAQTGGEGELGDDARSELERLGWRWRPRDTSERDTAHAPSPSSAPPAGAGERQAPVSDSSEWERTAHEEADAARRGSDDAPSTGTGTGAGGGDAPRVGGS